MSSKPFRIRWPADCEACGEAMEVDEFACYDGDGRLIHTECDEDRKAISAWYIQGEKGRNEVRHPLCPRCHLQRPCEHDEEEAGA